MAINPETEYPGKIAPSTAQFPYGKARNITNPSDGTGTPWEQALVNDIFGFQQSLLSRAAITPSGTPDEVGASQYLDSLFAIFGTRVDSTVALIADVSAATAGDLFLSGGYATKGDGAGAQWKATGNTITASQTAGDTGTATISNANGDEFELVFTRELDTTKLGALTIGDGAVIAALESAKNTGADVLLPLSAKVDFGGTTWVVQGCTLRGGGVYILGDYTIGGFVHTTDITNEVIKINAGGRVIGAGFYHPNQVLTASPIVYPAVIQLDNSVVQSNNNLIEDNTFVNSYVAIDLNGAAAAANVLTTVSRNRICAISKCINHPHTLTECTFEKNDASYLHWPESVGQLIRGVINNSAVFIALGDCDGTNLHKNTVFGMGTFIAFSSTPALTTVTGNLVDGCYRAFTFAEEVALGMVNSSGNTYSCKDPISGATDAAGFYGRFTTGTVTGTINSTGDLFTNTDGDHIDIEASGAATCFIRLNINSTFLAAGRNDPGGTHYGIRVVDASSNMAVKINAMFEDQVNGAAGSMTGIYLDGVDIAKISGTFESLPVGINIQGSNVVGRHQVDAIFRNVTDEIIDSTNNGQVQIVGMFDSTVPAQQITVASAATVTLPKSTFEMIRVSGTTTITSIDPTFYDDTVDLIFNGGLTVTDGGNLKLNGNFNTSGDDVLTLKCDGTNWFEKGRSAN